MNKDKIFNNLEFRSDSWDSEDNLLNTTFDTLTTWNEYQEGTLKLTNIFRRPSGLKRKFRIWRADIPRAAWTTAGGIKKQDRMRNPWIYLKLEKTVPAGITKQKKIEMHDLIVDYYI